MTTPQELLIKKAVSQVWQNPSKDNQVIVEMTRISPRNGYKGVGTVSWDAVETPMKEGYFHFYQLGDNWTGDFSLIAKKNQWYRLDDWCKVIDLVIHVYNGQGVLIPVSNVFTIRLYNDNLIIAIKVNDRIVNLNTDKVYIHFYRNNFYSDIQKDSQQPHIEYYNNMHTRKTNVKSFLEMRHYIDTVRTKGKTRLTLNGYLVENLDPRHVVDGDITEIYYDMSIRKVVDIPFNKLRTFKSDLDQKYKYLIHPPKDDVECIDYLDDVDFFICKKDRRLKQVKGVYYHRNQKDAVRMVTHRDYSLPVPYVMACVEHLDNDPDLDDFFIRLYVRDNGPRKTLIEDVNMIKSMYHLDDDKIYEAMLTVDSTIPEWRAHHLESSAYTHLMRCDYTDITLPLVLDAFGYSTIASTIANPNHRVKKDPNGNYFILPEGLQSVSTIFEYNRHGLLLNWWVNRNTKKYYPRSEDCVFIEAIAGEGQDDLTIHIGTKAFDLKHETSYRIYLSDMEGNKILENWHDVTNGDHILIDGIHCSLKYNELNQIALALGDDRFLCYDTEISGQDGVYDFRLTYGIEHTTPLIIPPGKIDIWMNGHALVEGIDFFIDFPNVCITTKEYAQERARQKVTVRCTGFPFDVKGVLKRVLPREIGYIEHDRLSVDAHYDLHHDRVIRTVVDGGVFDPSVVHFDEDGTANTERLSEDGRPYAIETPYINLKGSMNIALYQSQIQDYDLTKRASDYLTINLPKPNRDKPPVIRDKYNLYSPFLSRITLDIIQGRLFTPNVKASAQVVDKVVDKYKRYLTLDPAYLGYNEEFANVHPHNQKYVLELNAKDMAFLERINKTYLNGKVDMTQFFNVRKGK